MLYNFSSLLSVTLLTSLLPERVNFKYTLVNSPRSQLCWFQARESMQGVMLCLCNYLDYKLISIW